MEDFGGREGSLPRFGAGGDSGGVEGTRERWILHSFALSLIPSFSRSFAFPLPCSLVPKEPSIAACVLLVLLAAGCRQDPRRPLSVEPARYRQMVSAFYTGVAALRVGPDRRAEVELRAAARLVPDEPATWANLAILSLRRADLDGATAALEKARALVPDDSGIAHIAGLLESRRGRPREAMAQWRRAIALDPRNLRARYALIEAIRLQSPASRAEERRELEALVGVQPENLRARLELARLAAESGDVDLLHGMLAWLRQASARWPESARRVLGEAEVAASSDLREAAARLAGVLNLLAPTPAHRQSFAALKADGGTVADPIERFLRLPSPAPAPAAPDTHLAFAIQEIHTAPAPWARVLELFPAPAPDGAAKDLVEKPAPDILTLLRPDGNRVTLEGKPGVALPFPGRPTPEGCLVLDWGNDGHPDLVLAGSEGVRLFRNVAPAGWQEVTARSGLPAVVTGGAYFGAWAFDVELDGDLDIALGTATGSPPVLRNNGDGTWAVIHPFPGLSGLRGFAWADLDQDGDPDVAAIDGRESLRLLDNGRSGDYRLWPAPAGVGSVRALSVADVDRDGALDLMVLARDGSVQRVSRSGAAEAGSVAELVRLTHPIDEPAARVFWADLDNNGAVDLVVSAGPEARIWLTGERGRLFPLPSPIPGRVFSIADLNADGRLDFVGAAGPRRPIRGINRGTRSYTWTMVRPRGIQVIHENAAGGNNKINTFALGGEAEIRAGLLVQKQPITGPTLHFGLGENTTANVLRLLWPNGQPHAEFDLASGKWSIAKQRLNNSCPWLFAFDGRGMRFVTDLLWKSPLGLRINAQDTAGISQTRDWVKIRGDQLAARDGFYELSVTSELWETNFFDLVALMVVDHPAETELFVDERFSIPQPPLALHVTAPVRPIQHAVDDQGEDVTAVLRHRDSRCLDTFELGQYQGVARDHYLELELPGGSASEERERREYLVAAGWVFPTDSSINVALSQRRHPRPRGVSLEVPNGRGGWSTARAGLGFPAGKSKTVLFDLANLFPRGGPQPRRLRLRTNLEIYWDAVGVATARPGTPLRKQVLAATTATLRFRGFSRIRQANRRSQETPDYQELESTRARWLDLIGFYTRFGDVRELLQRVDDRYVLCNAGDEIALRFAAPPAPPSGWRRDFVFVSDGWDKDGNFNTVFSKTVLPLPSHDQSDYRRPPGRLQDDPVYRRHARDGRVYHTRDVTPEGFRRSLWPREPSLAEPR